MNDFDAYAGILTKSCWIMVIICLLIIVAAVIIYPFAKKQFEKSKHKMIALVCSIFIVGAIIIGAHSIYSTVSDISNQNYVVYTGTFTYENRKLHIVSEDGEKKTLSVAAYTIPDGTHEGIVIYGKNTEIVVCCQVYT